MFRIVLFIIFFLLSLISNSFAKTNEYWSKIVGLAFFENRSYDFLERLCDEAGGRLPGSENNEKGLLTLKSELAKEGVEVEFESFSMPGWRRGADKISALEPFRRDLRIAALGYVDAADAFEAEVVDALHGCRSDYDTISAKGKIVIVDQKSAAGKPRNLRYEAIEIAAEQGAKAILFIHDKIGGLTLSGASNFSGKPAAIPAFSVTFEEGYRIRRLLKRGVDVKLRVETKSRCIGEEIVKNAVARVEGRSKKKIVVGAHYDSWDFGQGGVDNGHGTAILFDVARILTQIRSDNLYAIEFVWFNAEELGLWGSRKYVEAHKNDSIIAMINMDMTGSPNGFNAMGFEEFVPFFEDLCDKLNGFDMSRGVSNNPWTNSDHMYFMLEGIPSFTLSAHLDEDMYHYYHDFGDTFDKASKRYISDAAAIVSLLAYELANAEELEFKKLSREETRDMLIEHNLDERLKRQKQWIFTE